MNRLLIVLSFIIFHLSFIRAQTLEECQQAAERNYPLIQQYGLIEKTTELTLGNIQKGWLPQVSATAQATLQSDVTAFPDAMQQLYQQMGITMEGLRRDQYRVGVDVQQLVFDGGAISSQRETALRQGEVQSAQNAVSIYNVRKRVNDMYFGLLLIDEQMKLNSDLQELLGNNEQRLASMYEHGTAAQSDYLNVRAERLSVLQQRTGLEAQRRALVRMLSAFCGRGEITPVKPDVHEALQYLRPSMQEGDGVRPELTVIDAQLRLADAQEKALDAALMPRLTVFAQGFYGYPGYNMFEDMMHRQWSWNGMIGARLTWNIGALYTRRNDKARIDVQRSMFNVQRETFLFNNNLEQIQQNENIDRYRSLLAADDEIVALRQSVRQAAESKLAHGIIDANDLVREINNENAARVQRSVHEIEMLKEIYDQQFTLNIDH